jgi:DNA repair exonuclease SbcCD ATPase subunit
MNNNLLNEIEKEIKRFQKRITACRVNNSNQNNAAIKRSALDLKNELTKITQYTKYTDD